MNLKYLRIFSILTLFLTIFAFSNILALPNDKGVQMYNQGVGTDDVFFVKGTFYNALFGVEDLIIKTGNWVTLSFGVFDIVESLDDLDAILDGFRDFVNSFYWSIIFDGNDITDVLINSGRYDSPIITVNDGGTYRVVVRYVYYINPQAKGVYDYFGAVGADENNLFIVKSSQIIWEPGRGR